ncbi:MAG: ComF family protein [Archangiaceae bacterium]|nr:ComF family protein [Archangiaceae bacterium]
MLEVLFPSACVACDAVLSRGRFFCADCAPLLLEVGPVHCGRCAEPGRFADGVCPRCRKVQPDFHRAFAPYEHDGAIARAIHRFKYEDHPELAGPLGALLSERSADFLARAPVHVCPIPLHARRYRERRYDQATLLAAALCRARPGLTLADGLLERHRATERQVGLSDEARVRNVSGAFTARSGVEAVLLIDDVLTTGATASAAARALRRVGVRRVEVLSLCRATRVFLH